MEFRGTTVQSETEGASIVAFRRQTVLQLDYCFSALRSAILPLTQSVLHGRPSVYRFSRPLSSQVQVLGVAASSPPPHPPLPSAASRPDVRSVAWS